MFTRRDDVTCIKHPPGTCSDRNLSCPAYATKSESLSIAHGKDRNYRHGTMVSLNPEKYKMSLSKIWPASFIYYNLFENLQTNNNLSFNKLM